MIIFPVETTGFPASMLNVYPRVAAVFSHPHVEEWFVSRKQLVFFGFDQKSTQHTPKWQPCHTNDAPKHDEHNS
jgi:hypothetical protein